MEQHYLTILRDTESWVATRITHQIHDRNNKAFGGIVMPSGVVEAKPAFIFFEQAVAVYLNEDSHYYRDDDLYEHMMAALSFAARTQHENGLFDYVTCNFYSAPDTCFMIKMLMPSYYYLKRQESITEKEQAILDLEDAILRKAAHGIAEGGFHTPNHRWAITSSLLELWKLYGGEELKERAEQYLAEGIDCNEDGEYAEKSAGNYNRVNNDAMITIGEVTGDPSWDKYVIRNLHMMLHYWEPDGSVFTANSTRWDKDNLMYPTDYYYEYMMMGVRHQIPEFLRMANTIMDICRERGQCAPLFLMHFMLHPKWRTIEVPEPYETPDYHVFYENSQIARVRTGSYTWTVLGGKSNFLYFHNGAIKLEMKVAGSFCEHRAFKADTVEPYGNGFHLHQTMHGWYYLPWTDENRPATSDWWQMDNENKRERLHGPNMEIDVYVNESDEADGIDVRVVTKGVDGDPWRIELAFTGANFMENEHMATYLNGNEAITVKDGYTSMSNYEDAIIVGPGFGTHHFMEGKEDSEARNAGSSTLYFTDYTGFDRTISIRNRRSRHLPEMR